MKKGLAFLSLFLTLLMSLGVASAAYLLTYYSTADDRGTVTPVLDLTSRAVIENYEDGATVPYARFASLENALVEAADRVQSSGKNVDVYLIPGSELLVENATLTIENGVDFYMPYQDKMWDVDLSAGKNEAMNSIKGSFVDKDAKGVASYRKSYLALSNSTITIRSGGGMYIGGLFRTKGLGGNYTEVGLDPNSSITVEGVLYNYGCIKEIGNVNCESHTAKETSRTLGLEEAIGLDHTNSFDPNRFVKVKSGGTFHGSIAIYDLGGGSTVAGLILAKICPINILDFPTTQTYLSIEQGGTFLAQVRAYLNMSGQVQSANETAGIVAPSGSGTASLLYLSSGSVSFEYCPSTPDYTKDDQSRIHIGIHGQVDLGSLYFDLGVAEVDTSEMFLPLSYKLRISIDSSGILSASNDIKLLGGEVIEIDSGGRFNVGGSFIAYRGNSLSGINDSYPTTFEEARIINNGSFVLNPGASFGGSLITRDTSGGATVNLSAVSQEALTAVTVDGVNETQISMTATGMFLNEATMTGETSFFKAGTMVRSDSSGFQCWVGDYLAVYTIRIVPLNPNSYEHPTIGYQVYSYDANGGSERLLSGETGFVTDMVTQEYSIERGQRFAVVSLDRAERTYFSAHPGAGSLSFTSGSQYEMNGNYEVSIQAGEGVLVKFSNDRESGSAGSAKTISEGPSSSGPFATLASISGNEGAPVELSIRKGHYVTYRWESATWNPLKGCSLDERIYIIDGLMSFEDYSNDIDTYYSSHSDFVYEVQESAEANQGSVFNPAGRNILSQPIQIEDSKTIHVRLIYDGEPDDLGGDSSGGDGGGCFAEGTIVTMGDGSLRAIEEVSVGDELLSFSHESGEFESRPVMFMSHGERAHHDVLNLRFDNGTVFRVVYGHTFLNAETRLYDEIRVEDHSRFVGNSYLSVVDTAGGYSLVPTVLEEAYVTHEYVAFYNPATMYNLNHVAQGMLALSDDIRGLYNYFELDEGYAYDEEKKAADIEKYGLLTYEEVAFIPNMTEELFDVFNAQYLKVSLGKGLFTFDELVAYVMRWGDQVEV